MPSSLKDRLESFSSDFDIFDGEGRGKLQNDKIEVQQQEPPEDEPLHGRLWHIREEVDKEEEEREAKIKSTSISIQAIEQGVKFRSLSSKIIGRIMMQETFEGKNKGKKTNVKSRIGRSKNELNFKSLSRDILRERLPSQSLKILTAKKYKSRKLKNKMGEKLGLLLKDKDFHKKSKKKKPTIASNSDSNQANPGSLLSPLTPDSQGLYYNLTTFSTPPGAFPDHKESLSSARSMVKKLTSTSYTIQGKPRSPIQNTLLKKANKLVLAWGDDRQQPHKKVVKINKKKLEPLDKIYSISQFAQGQGRRDDIGAFKSVVFNK